MYRGNGETSQGLCMENQLTEPYSSVTLAMEKSKESKSRAVINKSENPASMSVRLHRQFNKVHVNETKNMSRVFVKRTKRLFVGFAELATMTSR
jgi:hypothetical protein